MSSFYQKPLSTYGEKIAYHDARICMSITCMCVCTVFGESKNETQTGLKHTNDVHVCVILT